MIVRRRKRRRGRWIGIGLAGVALLLLLLALAGRRPQQATPQQGPPPSAAATPTPVPSAQRLVMTYYYYWYDATTGAHLQPDSLRYHPPTSPEPSWRNVQWHKKELADMTYAGIDVVLPVYWGFDRPNDAWSWQGLPVLAQAWTELHAAGEHPPQIGMFFDTTIVNWRNLTTPEGMAWFYANFHDYFSRIPRQQWALIDGQPIVFLFTSDWTTAMNQSTFDYVNQHFQMDFGVTPYVVREVSWDYPILEWRAGERVRDYSHPIHTANSYLWAAAIHGFVNRGGVAAVGPGYDDHLIPGRDMAPVSREGGSFYRRAFQAAIDSGKPLLAIETWNEFHEGSNIAETIEYGRQYLDITREMSAKFHARRGQQ